MNYYYVDRAVEINGDGTKLRPFKSLSDFVNSNFTQPFTLKLIGKQQEILEESLVFGNKFINKTGEMSYITCDGLYSVLSIKDIPMLKGVASWLTLEGVRFEHAGQTENNTKINLELHGDSSDITNVWIDRCLMVNAPWVNSGKKNFAVYMGCWTNPKGVGHKFGVKNTKFIRTSAGINAIGNTPPTSDIDNRGDNLRAYGVVIEDCNFIDLKADAAILNGCASKNGDPSIIIDEWTSRITNCFSGGIQYHSANVYTVPFWFYASNNCLIEKTISANQAGTITDKQAFDFDERCWGCVIKDCYSYDNGGGFILTSSWGSNFPMPSDWAAGEYDWYYTRRFGGGNNKVINCVSFNDGISRGAVQLQGYHYNLRFIDCDIIRTDGYASDAEYNIFFGSYISHSQISINNNEFPVVSFEGGSIITPNYLLTTKGLTYAGNTGAHTTISQSLAKFSDIDMITKTMMSDDLLGGAIAEDVRYSVKAVPFSGSAWTNESAVRNALLKIRE